MHVSTQQIVLIIMNVDVSMILVCDGKYFMEIAFVQRQEVLCSDTLKIKFLETNKNIILHPLQVILKEQLKYFHIDSYM